MTTWFASANCATTEPIDLETISTIPVEPHDCGQPGGCIPFAPTRARRWAKDDLMAEIDFLLSMGESVWSIAAALERSLETLERSAHRAGRRDLAAQFLEQREQSALAGITPGDGVIY